MVGFDRVGSGRGSDAADIRKGWRNHQLAHVNSAGGSSAAMISHKGSNGAGYMGHGDRKTQSGSYQEKVRSAQLVKNGRVVKSAAKALPGLVAAPPPGAVVHYRNGYNPSQDAAFNSSGAPGEGNRIIHYRNGIAPEVNNTIWEPPESVSSMSEPGLANGASHLAQLTSVAEDINGYHDVNGHHHEISEARALDSVLGFGAVDYSAVDYTGPGLERIHYVPHAVSRQGEPARNSAITNFWSETSQQATTKPNGSSYSSPAPPQDLRHVLVEYNDSTPFDSDSISTSDLTVLNRYKELGYRKNGGSAS